MSARARSLVATALLALAAASAQAIEYRSVAAPTILYETPSVQGRKLYIIAEGTPVEIVVQLDRWIKVRDPGGAISWIERDKLRAQRTLMVVAQPAAAVRAQPAGDADKVFEAATDVVLELVSGPADGWVQVRHPDGGTGHVRVTDVWGL
jgi:SH3-like domain-containing protein